WAGSGGVGTTSPSRVSAGRVPPGDGAGGGDDSRSQKARPTPAAINSPTARTTVRDNLRFRPPGPGAMEWSPGWAMVSGAPVGCEGFPAWPIGKVTPEPGGSGARGRAQAEPGVEEDKPVA